MFKSVVSSINRGSNPGSSVNPPTNAAPQKRNVLARTRDGLVEHFRSGFKPGAEVTYTGGFVAGSTADDVNSLGRDGTTGMPGLSHGVTHLGKERPAYGGKNPTPGNNPSGAHLNEHKICKTETLKQASPQPKTRKTVSARMKTYGRAFAKAFSRRVWQPASTGLSNGLSNGLGALGRQMGGGEAPAAQGATNASGAANAAAPGSAEARAAQANAPEEEKDYLPTRTTKDYTNEIRERFPGLKFESYLDSHQKDASGMAVRVDPNVPAGDGTNDSPVRKAIKQQHEADLAALIKCLERIHGFVPGAGYFYALPLVDALAEACYGDPRLAVEVLNEMERIRVISGADNPAKHDSTKAALACMDRLDTWLVDRKPKLYLQPPAKKDAHPEPRKVFSKIEREQAFTRTAALMSSTDGTACAFDAFCLATGITTPRDLYAEKSKEEAHGAAGPHRLDLLHAGMGKRLVLTYAQALHQGDGQHRGDSLCSRVIGETRQIAGMMKDPDVMKAIRKASKRAAAAAEKKAEAQNLSPIQRKYDIEVAARKKRIDLLIKGDEKRGVKGIGMKAFVDLECWLNDMHTDAEIDHRGRMAKEFARDYQVCEALSQHPPARYLGVFRHLVGEQSAFYARQKLGGGVVSNKHPDEDQEAAVKTTATILDMIAPAQLDQQSELFRAVKVANLLLTAGLGLEPGATEEQKLEAINTALNALQQAENTNRRNAIDGQPLKAASTSIEPADIEAFCSVFAHTNLPRPYGIDTLQQFFLRDDYSHGKYSHLFRVALTRHVGTLLLQPNIPPAFASRLAGHMERLIYINEGDFMRGSGNAEDVCRKRLYMWLYRQDNSEQVTDGVNGTVGVSLSAPISPDGLGKVTVGFNMRSGFSKEMRNASENLGNQMAIGHTKTKGATLSVSGGYGGKAGVGEAGVEAFGGAELALAKDYTNFVGVQITTKRHGLNLVDDKGNIVANELAQEYVEGIGRVGEFRAVSCRVEDFHRRLACNPDNLSNNEIIEQYPEELRPNVKLSDKDRRVTPHEPRNYTDEERRAMRDPAREEKLLNMTGREYFDQFYAEFCYDDHAIAITENHRDVDSTKVSGGVNARVSAESSKNFKAELRLDLIKHTFAHDVDHRHDTRGAYRFSYILNNRTHSTTIGASATATAPKGLISDDESVSGRVSANRRIGYTLERSLIKLTSEEGKTVPFYTYCGQNFTSFKEFKDVVYQARDEWAAMLRSKALPRNGMDDHTYAEAQKTADRANLDTMLEYLEKLDPHQAKQYLVRFRLRESASRRFDQLRGELQYTETTYEKTALRLSKLQATSGNGEKCRELQKKLDMLEHSLDRLYEEKITLLSSSSSWALFGLGTGRSSAKSMTNGAGAEIESSPVDADTYNDKTNDGFVRMFTGPVKPNADISESMSYSDYCETGWLKETSLASEKSYREAWRMDIRETAALFRNALMLENDVVELANGINGLIKTGMMASMPARERREVEQHIHDVLEQAPREIQQFQAKEHASRKADKKAENERKAEEKLKRHATTRLCRQLLTLNREDLLETLIDAGRIDLHKVLSECVKSKRINLAERLLEWRKLDIEEASKPGVPDSRWNIRAALDAMHADDRYELLYGLMVRDWDKDTKYRKATPAAFQGPGDDFTATAWQGRTMVGDEANAANNARRGHLAEASFATNNAKRGHLADWLMVNNLIDRGDAIELMYHRTNQRTVAFAVTHAYGKGDWESALSASDDVLYHLEKAGVIRDVDLDKRFNVTPAYEKLMRELIESHTDERVALELGRGSGFYRDPTALKLERALRKGDGQTAWKQMGLHHWHAQAMQRYSEGQRFNTRELRVLLEAAKPWNGKDARTVMPPPSGAYNERVLAVVHLSQKEGQSARLLADIIRAGKDGALNELVSHGIGYDRDDDGERLPPFRRELSRAERDKFVRMLSSQNLLEGLSQLYQVNTEASHILRAALADGNPQAIRRLVNEGHISIDQLCDMHGQMTDEEVNTTLSALRGPNMRQAIRPSLPRLPPDIARKLILGAWGSPGEFLQRAINRNAAAEIRILLDAGYNLAQVIDERMEAEHRFGRRYLAALVGMLDQATIQGLSNRHIEMLLRYALENPDQADAVLNAIAATLCVRLPSMEDGVAATEQQVDLIAILSTVRLTYASAKRLIEVLAQHKQLDAAMTNALDAIARNRRAEMSDDCLANALIDYDVYPQPSPRQPDSARRSPPSTEYQQPAEA